ncbi:hypothetical protein P1X15_11305 [Runella sp. MFBS21]|uniref:hypothetical protein n=1 Tax=Runella sp. MFBS21 TaxID=3034018 RepID=UPI0023F7B073|nr:hypothetical protein [Runella sp. MFBS21]MDF7818188.1 hypothetical protein [Runella sp. MFBS21]
MQKYLKAGLLTIVLVLPALVLLFLHLFAENHFKLPYLVPLKDTTGAVKMMGKDTVFYKVPGVEPSKINVVGFWKDEEASHLAVQFSRVQKLASEEIVFRRVRSDEAEFVNIYKLSPLKKYQSSETIPYTQQFVLIDKKGHIRGFYDGSDPVEVDRLIAELKILLDIYKKEKT